MAFLLLLIALNAQPNYIFEGGVGGGHSSILTTNVFPYFYEGGNGAGYAQDKSSATNAYVYFGGNGDGFAFSTAAPANIYIYEGGLNSGYYSERGDYQGVTIYEGGINEGYAAGKELYQGVTLYEGGIGDGYDMLLKWADFIWTGAVGTGWGVTGNWNYDIVPDISRPVIIPSGVPNYPYLNAGIFAIGANPNAGPFVCKSLWIQDGALLVTRVNSFVENYGVIEIDGTMQVKNTAPAALQNLAGSITISSGGLLKLQP